MYIYIYLFIEYVTLVKISHGWISYFGQQFERKFV
jgi:hypothetical protein